MRRLGLIIAVAVMATLLVSIASVTAGAQTTDSPSQLSVSQGTVTGANPSERRAAARDMAEEEKLPNYSQVVDNTHSSRFDAPGWKGVGVTFGPMEATTSRRAPPQAMRASS